MPSKPIQVICPNEYAPLKTVMVCKPQYLMKPETMDVSLELAQKQHRHFVSALKDYGIEVIYLSPLSQFPEQVFTRDIGFVLGSSVFSGKISNFLRQGEEEYFQQWLQKEKLPFQLFSKGKIEGGDVLLDGKTLYVGLSNRTNKEATSQLQSFLPNYEVREIPFTDAYLHLDCVFNILSATEAIIFREEIHGKMVEELKERYDLIEVSKDEQATLGVNVLSIGHKRVISQPVNERLNSELKHRGYEVIEVDFSEIIKFGGAFRCCTLPLLRRYD